MSNLFISHSSRDNAAAKELQARLEEQGHRSVFLDLDPEAGIQAGVSWERTLYTKLRACRAVVALCSETYLASQWCFAEVALARMEGKELFVLQIDPWSEETQMPSILTEEQFIDLRTNKDDGYQRLWNGFKVKGIVPAEAREWGPDEPPYPGLRSFREEDAPIFFGRDEEIRSGSELLNRVRRQGHPRLVMVLGSSGSGKSSLVRAGIVPQLRRDRGQWLVVKPFRPGRQPARELAASLSLAFDEAGQAFGWEDIHRWLDPAAAGDLAEPAPEPSAAAEAEPSPAAAREQLLKALSAMEGELTAGDDKVARSVRRLKDFLGQQQTRTPLPSGGAPPPSGESPLAELAFRLRLQSGFAETSVVLVIDQFEELLGHDGEHPASRFLAMLRTAMEAEDSPLLVVGTMRSDYLGVLQRSAPLQGLGFKSLSVGPMSKDGMRQIIEEPAKLGGIQLENGLSDLLLEDTETSDALPLLAFTLRMMWDRYRDKRLLEIREYKDFGRLQGAIAQVADETFEDALEQVQEKDARDALERELRDAFLGMARPAAEGSGWSRQPVSWDQLSETVRSALEPFIDPQRLLVKRPDGTVEVAHEALFRSWDRLEGWLNENAEGLHLLREIQVEAKRWDEAAAGEEKEPYLWRGGRLTRALELRDGGVLALQDLDRSFVDASEGAERARVEAEAERRRQRLRTARRWAVGLGLLAAVAIALGLWAWRLKVEAIENLVRARDALRVAVVREQMNDGATAHTRVAVLREVEAEDPTTVRGWAAQRLRALNEPVTEAILPAGQGAVVSRALFSPDGRRILTTAEDGTARLWNAEGPGEPDVLAGPAEPQAIDAAAFSPDGGRLVTGYRSGTARLWTAESPTEPAVLPGPADSGRVSAAAFGPKGRRLVTGYADGTARLWSARDGSELATLPPHLDSGWVTGVAFDTSGEWFATAYKHGTARKWTAKGEGLPAPFPWQPEAASVTALGPSGRRIVTAPLGKRARVRSFDGQSEVLLGDATVRVHAASFSPNGERVVTGRDDGSVQVWEADTGKLVAQPPGYEGPGGMRTVYDVEFSPDGERVADASQNHTARVWDVADPQTPILLEGHEGGVSSVRFGSDPERIVTASLDRTARLWNVSRRGEVVLQLQEAAGRTRAVGFSAGGVLVAYDDGSAREWTPEGGAEVVPASQNMDCVAAFSPDGRRVVKACDGGAPRVSSLDGSGAWFELPEIMEDAPPGTPAEPAWVRSAAFSPGGERFVTAYNDGKARIWSATGPSLLTALSAESGKPIYAVAFGPRAKRLVTGSLGAARVWSAVSGQELGVLERSPEAGVDPTEDVVQTTAFSPDGRYVVTGYDDGSGRIWDTERSDPPVDLPAPQLDIDHPAGPDQLAVNSATFSPDGKRVVVGHGGGSARVWSAGGELIVVLRGPRGPITSTAFSPDGKRIVTGYGDGSARVWAIADVASLWQRTRVCPSAAEREGLLGRDYEEAADDFERCREMVECISRGGDVTFLDCFRAYRTFRRSNSRTVNREP